MNPVYKFLYLLQEISFLIWRSLSSLYRKPRYLAETVRQMDSVGVGSLPIVLLTGFFTGGVLILQTFPTLQYYSLQNDAGRAIATSLIRELGPVLTALMVSGRIGSAISAELGSMVVSQQIDAMRALGTDPNRKLVAPRIIAGGVTASVLYNQDYNVFITSVRNGISTEDIIGGCIKPVFFGLIIGSVACYKGLSTEGGTVGVGRSTTSAVVLASIWVIIFDFFLSKAIGMVFDIGHI
jgi:phospholipid/cholesterol/gamma-HCH transport system permease protein